MIRLSDLLSDLVEEILSRVPLRTLRRVRSTCKTWNALSKTMILGQKAIKKQFMAFVRIDYRVCLLRFELDGIHKDLADLSLKQINIPHHRQVFHCDGLLLCVPEDESTLLVWNPYLGQTRWLRPRPRTGFYCKRDMYTIGYDDKNNRNHKIIRFSTYGTKHVVDVFDFRSASWSVFDVNPILKINYSDMFQSMSLKGNTYFCCKEIERGQVKNYLLCFDFTTERFRPPLPLPQPDAGRLSNNVTLTNVGDEKLALLYNNYEPSKAIVIWMTTKIDPNAVTWTKFLTLDMKLHVYDFKIYCNGRGFLIDEEKKVLMLFDMLPMSRRYRMTYIVGEDVYFRYVNMGDVRYLLCDATRMMCSCFVPSLVQPQV